MRAQPDIAIIGAGIIGLSCAAEFARRGASVTMFDTSFHPGRGASWAAAGMIAPAFEAAAEQGANPMLLDLCLASASLWPDFAAGLKQATGRDVLFSPGPTLATAQTDEDLVFLDTLAAALTARSLPFARLSPEEAVRLEPHLTSDTLGALRLDTDGQVDNRLVVEALIRQLQKTRTVRFETSPAPLQDRGGKIGLEGFDHVLVCAGWQTPDITVENARLGNLVPTVSAVTPVAGHMMALMRQSGSPQITLRNGSLYLVPKAGRLVVGATVEPGMTATTIDMPTIRKLEAAARELCPHIETSQMIEAWRGVRPSTPDHAPMIGALADTGLHIATGHYRNGILLAPITAKIVADMMLDGQVSGLAAAFSPDRFSPATA